MIVVDTSALLALLFDESDALDYASALAGPGRKFISAPTLVETHLVAFGRYNAEGSQLLGRLVDKSALIVVAFDERQAGLASSAFRKYGRGTGHPAQLNMGDTFSYALAKSRSLPLLFKGDDFIHTDVIPVKAPIQEP